MNADETDRTQLREMLLDDVTLPSETVRETMFERTFASPPGAGQELLPPDGLFDLPPDDETGDERVDGDEGHRPGVADDITDPGTDEDEAVIDDGPARTPPDPGDPATAGHDAGDEDASSGDPFPGW